MLNAAQELVDRHAQGGATLGILTELLGDVARVFLSPARIDPYFRPKPEFGVAVLLRDDRSDSLVLIELESELAAHLCSILLARPVPIVDRFRPAPDSVQGAVGALLLSTSRKCLGDARMDLLAISAAARTEFLKAAHQFVVAIDGQVAAGRSHHRFSLTILSSPVLLKNTPRFDLTMLREMGDVLIDLSLVAARFHLPSCVVSSLQLGDALMPGQGWLIQGHPEGSWGQLLLCAPGGQVALCAELHRNKQVVLGEKLMNMPAYEASEPAKEDDGEPTVADVIAQAPLVVQIELGCVSLSACHWADLKPGDVISTGHPLGDHVTVRVAGREVASGELVDVDGELGVRIKSFTSRERVTQ